MTRPASSCRFTVPPELSPEVAAALARAHGRVLVPTADRVGASKCGGSVGVASVGVATPCDKAVSHPHDEGIRMAAEARDSQDPATGITAVNAATPKQTNGGSTP